MGLRGEARVIESDYLAETIVDGRREVYLGLDNAVDYRERVGAAYAQWAREGERWGLQAGLRYEYTYIGVDQADGEAVGPGGLAVAPEIDKRYHRLFPSATVSRELGERWSANVSYSSRIRRPGFWMINPFGTGVENPNQLQLGNADIDPSFTDAVELKALFKTDQLTLNPFVSLTYVHGFFDQFVSQDSTGLVRQFPINLDRERQVAGGLTVSYAPTAKWQLSGEAYLGRFRQRGTFAGVDFGNAFTTSSLQLSVRGELWAGVQAQATYDYLGGQRYARFFRDPVSAIRAGLSRQFLGERLQVALNVRNLFELQRFRGGERGHTFVNRYERLWQGERWQLTATWDWGKDVRMRRARGSIR